MGRSDQLRDGAHPSSSLGVSDEAKVSNTNRSLWHSNNFPLFQARQVRNELAIEKIVRRRSLDG
jgi:hypothetical protein